MKTLAEKRMSRGIQVLDQAIPGWALRIDLDKFYMGSSMSCVLGQIFGHYGLGLDALGFGWTEGFKFGFDTRKKEDRVTFDQLDRAWRQEIKGRQEVARELAAVS